MQGTVSSTMPGIVCGQCGRPNALTRHRCERCGAPLADETPRSVRPLNGCPACGVLAQRGARYCVSCGGPTEVTLTQWRGSASTAATAWTHCAPGANVAPEASASKAGGEKWHGALTLVLIAIFLLGALAALVWMVGW